MTNNKASAFVICYLSFVIRRYLLLTCMNPVVLTSRNIGVFGGSSSGLRNSLSKS